MLARTPALGAHDLAPPLRERGLELGKRGVRAARGRRSFAGGGGRGGKRVGGEAGARARGEARAQARGGGGGRARRARGVVLPVELDARAREEAVLR